MNELIAALQNNSLPAAYWVIVAVWVCALAAQFAILKQEQISLRRVAGPVIMGAAIFSIGFVSSEQFQAFIAGGRCVTAVISLGFAGYWHSLASKGIAPSPRQRLKALSFAACALAVLGIAFTQLALLGAALFLAATSIGYLRKHARGPDNA